MLFISMSRDQHSNVVSGGAGLILSALITTQSNIQKITIMRNGAGVILSALIVPPRCTLSTSCLHRHINPYPHQTVIENWEDDMQVKIG